MIMFSPCGPLSQSVKRSPAANAENTGRQTLPVRKESTVGRLSKDGMYTWLCLKWFLLCLGEAEGSFWDLCQWQRASVIINSPLYQKKSLDGRCYVHWLVIYAVEIYLVWNQEIGMLFHTCWFSKWEEGEGAGTGKSILQLQTKYCLRQSVLPFVPACCWWSLTNLHWSGGGTLFWFSFLWPALILSEGFNAEQWMTLESSDPVSHWDVMAVSSWMSHFPHHFFEAD